jgi:hypothetical protein
MLKNKALGILVMKREVKANQSGDHGSVEERSDNNCAEQNRGECEVRPELGVLGWAARAKRLFGAMTLHA